jgi:6-pyruvoyl-tetrahydropterin synthase
MTAIVHEVLAALNFKNLDTLPEFAGKNTTTEYMAGEIFRRLQARIAAGALGAGTAGALCSMRILLRESPVAWAAYEGPLP